MRFYESKPYRLRRFLARCGLVGFLSVAVALPSTSLAAQDSEAQSTTGSRLPVGQQDVPFTRSVPDQLLDAPVSESDRESFVVAEKLGACLVKGDAAGSMAFVMATPGSDVSRAAQAKLQPRMPDCLGESVDPFMVGAIKMTIQPSLTRGVIAEALYRLQFGGRAQPASHLSVPPILTLANADADHRNDAVIYEFVQCVTGSNPTAARSLILSKVGSSAEQSSLAALGPSLSPCLYKGQTLKINRLTFRARIAEALYRWSVSTTQTVVAAQSH